MKRRALLLVVTLLGAATLLGTATLLGGPASADPVSSCSATTGTIVAVDFHHWGGPIVRGCDTGHPKRGIDLLTDEGFGTTGTQHDGPTFVCRIGNQAYAGGTQYPTPADDSCVVTPPATAYWSYWLAAAGSNRWSYSQNGAYANTPRAGEVQLWIFGRTTIQGSGAPTDGFPTCTPNSLRAGGSPSSCTSAAAPPTHPTHPPTTTHTSAPTTRHSSAVPTKSRSTHSAGSPTAAHTSAAARTTGSATATASSSAAAPSGAGSTTGGASSGPVASGGSSAGTSAVAVDAKPASTHTDTGSALPLVLGIALAVLFAIGGGWIVRQRRRAGE